MELRQANPRKQGDIGEGIAAAWLMQQSGGQVWVLTAMCLVLSAISFASLLTIPESRHLSLKRD